MNTVAGRSLLLSHPDAVLVGRLPLLPQVAAEDVAACEPLCRLTRPYIGYRSGEERTPRRGWERVR